MNTVQEYYWHKNLLLGSVTRYEIFVAVSIHIGIIYGPIGGYECFIRMPCLCLQGRSQLGEEVVKLQAG
jgi:hypothetical protein